MVIHSHHERIQAYTHIYTTTVCTYTWLVIYLAKELLTNKIGLRASWKQWHQVGVSARRRVCHQPQATFLGIQPSMMTSEGMLRSITSPRPSCHTQKLQLRTVWIHHKNVVLIPNRPTQLYASLKIHIWTDRNSNNVRYSKCEIKRRHMKTVVWGVM